MPHAVFDLLFFELRLRFLFRDTQDLSQIGNVVAGAAVRGVALRLQLGKAGLGGLAAGLLQHCLDFGRAVEQQPFDRLGPDGAVNSRVLQDLHGRFDRPLVLKGCGFHWFPVGLMVAWMIGWDARSFFPGARIPFGVEAFLHYNENNRHGNRFKQGADHGC